MKNKLNDRITLLLVIGIVGVFVWVLVGKNRELKKQKELDRLDTFYEADYIEFRKQQELREYEDFKKFRGEQAAKRNADSIRRAHEWLRQMLLYYETNKAGRKNSESDGR